MPLLPPVPPMLISIHLPKTAGTAFRHLLLRHYGERLLVDRGDHPLSHAAPVRVAMALMGAMGARQRLQGHDAVHGHFLAIKYRHIPGPMITWLRDPVQRVVSRYEHYRRDVTEGRPLQAVRGLRPGLRLDEFIELPRYHNTCAKYFIGVSRQRLAWVGFTEDMPGSLVRLKQTIGLDLGDAVQANQNPHRDGPRYQLDPRVEQRIRTLNHADVEFWEWAQARFN